jgi:hypothetical protein
MSTEWASINEMMIVIYTYNNTHKNNSNNAVIPR